MTAKRMVVTYRSLAYVRLYMKLALLCIEFPDPDDVVEENQGSEEKLPIHAATNGNHWNHDDE